MSYRSCAVRFAARGSAVSFALLWLAGCSGAPSVPSLSPSLSALSPSTPGALAKPKSVPKGYSLLYSFKGSPDGAVPYGGVILGNKGELFGTTYSGGTTTPPAGGAGTVFALTKSGGGYVESVIHDFGPDGYNPSTAPTLDPSGSLYATVQSGPPGAGASGGVVSLTPSKSGYNESGVFAFSSGNGANPGSQLVEITDGSFLFYGTLLYTTALAGGASGNGSLAALTLALAYTDAYDFKGPKNDGSAPTGNLAVDMTRNVYGATSAGGNGPKPGYGAVFKYDPNTGKETMLYAFAGGTSDGAYPTGGVMLDVEGNLYGTTQLGGAQNRGVIFKLTLQPSGGYVESVLHSFGGPGDGASPYAAPTITISSNILYGTTFGGGANGLGTIYQIATNGTKYKTLYSFAKNTGASPGYGSLLLSGNALYGTTEAGGASGQGTVFRFVP